MVKREYLLSCALLALLTACQPDFPARASIVDGARVLAVQAAPAQAKPGIAVSYSLLVVDQRGTIPAPDASWSFCSLSKPPSQINDVNGDCFNGLAPDGGVTAFGTGPTATAMLPANACKQFGPDVPQTPAGPGRPVDADITGGYYQPVVLDVNADGQKLVAVAETRLVCGLPNGSIEQLNQILALAKINENPVLTRVSALELGTELTPEGSTTPLAVAAGSRLTLQAEWPACPLTSVCGDGICGPLEGLQDDASTGSTKCSEDCAMNARGCPGAEPYAWLDPLTHTVVVRHEEMRVSWFATAGAFDSDNTGNVEANFALTSSVDGWKAPATPGPVFMWAVLHDSRGGMSWQSFELVVQ